MERTNSWKSDPKRVVRVATLSLGVVIFLWHLYYAFWNPMDRTQHSNIHLGLLLVVFYLSTLEFDSSRDRRRKLRNAVTVGIILFTAIASIYVHVNFNRWLTEAQALLQYTTIDLAIGLLLILVTIHATWRAYGRLLALVIVGSLFYGLAGPIFPGLLRHSGISGERLIYMNSVSLEGVFGFLLGISSTWIIGFILFAGLVEAYGGMDYTIRIGTKVGSYIRSGIVQIAVVTSMVMGSSTGSSAANVATTGSFTIPLMMDNGVRGRSAGAIESVASTGGQMLPPVMGSAAFLMADILGISYFEVIRGAILPALLFYVATVVVVHLSALKNGWTTSTLDLSTDLVGGDPVDEGDNVDDVAGTLDAGDEGLGAETSDATAEAPAKQTRGSIIADIFEGIPYIISLLILLYTLVILRYDPMTAAMYTILALLAAALIRDLRRADSVQTGTSMWFSETVEGLRVGAVNMAPLTAVLASLGVVIRVLTNTGFTQRFSLQIISLAGGVFIGILIVAMLASIIFGLGMPTPAAYVVVATLTAPALVQVGVGELTAHIFVFYFALLSTITPPVALSCAVASGISGSTFMATVKETLRLGGFSFLIPFVFIFNDSLIYWNGVESAVAFVSLAIAMATLGVAIVGYNGEKRILYPIRLAYVIVALVVLFALSYSWVLQAFAAVMLVVWFLLRRTILTNFEGRFGSIRG